MPKNTDLQAARDVRRAEAIIEDTHAVDCWASARLLRRHAGDLGISIHAVALAVLSGDPLSTDGSCAASAHRSDHSTPRPATSP